MSDSVKARVCLMELFYGTALRKLTQNMRYLMKICVVVLAFAVPLPAVAENATIIAPVFAQLVTGPLPDGFVPAFENADATGYINEALPKGETLETWTQLITLTGAKGLAVGDAPTSALEFAEFLADKYKAACPDAHVAEQFETPAIKGARESFMGYLSCGAVNGGAQSESMVFLVMVGAQDIYTVQWAEHDVASPTGIAYGAEKWGPRLDQMITATRLCEILPGEPAPYPSCVQ